MSIADPHDRLQPALLDRISDDARESGAVDDRRVMTKAQLRQVRKSRYAELRGNDPRWTVRILVPAAIIVSGITGIISLFYTRST